MKVVYSVATKFGGSGIGTTAYNAAFGIYKSGILEKVYCSSRAVVEVPAEMIFSTGVSFFEGWRFLPSAYQWFLKDVSHDFLVSLNLAKIDFGAGDIFHVWNGHGLYSLRIAQRKGARIVVERASTHPLTIERIMNGEYRKRGMKFSQMLSLNRNRLLQEFKEADFITVPSDFSYKSMIENGIDEKKLIKIPFGADISRFRPAKNYDQPTFNVLFVGQVGFRKGVLYLLDAWKKLRLKDATLTIVGQEDFEIKKFLIPYKNDSSIKFIGYSDTLPIYQSSHVFVFPSIEEGSALVTYEAMACGLPLITTLESGSIVEEGKEGFIVPSSDVDSLAERIKYLYENRAIGFEMGARARSKVEDYTWENYGKNLVNFYETRLFVHG